MKTTPAAAPRSHTFRPPARYGFHAEFTSVCPGYCTDRHDGGAVEDPSDISHSTSAAMELCVAAPGQPAEEGYVMEAYVNLRPYSLDAAERVPHGRVTILDSVESPPLTPDAFAKVIDQFAEQLQRMRELHAVLVEAVAEHQGGAL